MIGTTVEATQAAKKLLKVTWSEAKGAAHDSERALEEFAAIARDKSREGVAYAKVGDAKAAMQGAAKVMRGEYRTRYLYHAQMEPLNATAAVGPDGKSVEIWAGTQSPTAVHAEVARALQTDPARITFHQYLLGGGFGRRSQVEVIVDAVLLAKAVGKPVKLIWSREDDIAFGKFRPMTAHHIEAGFDAGGKLIAWHHRVVAESVGAFMAAVAGRTPAPTDRIVMKGTPLPQYPIPNKLAEHVVERAARGLRPGAGSASATTRSRSNPSSTRSRRRSARIRWRSGSNCRKASRACRRCCAPSPTCPTGAAARRARARRRLHGEGRDLRRGRRRGLGRPRVRQDQGAQFLDCDRRRYRGAAGEPGGADRRQHRLRTGPRAAREDHHQGRPRAAVEFHRLRDGADVGCPEHRGEGDLDRQPADRGGRGRAAAGGLRGRQRHRGAHRRAAARVAVRAGARARRAGRR